VNHVAIDLGSKYSQVCMRTADGTIVLERKERTAVLPMVMRTWEPSRVVVETSSEAFRMADAAVAAGHEVRVVPGTLAKQLGIGERKLKTDLRDARKLSEISCRTDLRSVHVPSSEGRELRSLLKTRHLLIGSRTQLINSVRGWLRTHLEGVRTRYAPALPKRIREHAEARTLVVPVHVEHVLTAVEALNVQIKALDTLVETRALAHPVCRRLMSIPGVGKITALAFVASIDDVTRFPSAHHVGAYLGLTPGEDSSSQRQRRTSITKAGPSLVRFTLVQAAWVILRKYPADPIARWGAQIAARRGPRIAAVAVARKLASVMFALWRDNSSYNATRATRADSTQTGALPA
jgi:transposase